MGGATDREENRDGIRTEAEILSGAAGILIRR